MEIIKAKRMYSDYYNELQEDAKDIEEVTTADNKLFSKLKELAINKKQYIELEELIVGYGLAYESQGFQKCIEHCENIKERANNNPKSDVFIYGNIPLFAPSVYEVQKAEKTFINEYNRVFDGDNTSIAIKCGLAEVWRIAREYQYNKLSGRGNI